MIDERQIDEWFTYHPPIPGQEQRYTRIRNAAHDLALVIRENTPAGAAPAGTRRSEGHR